MAAKYHNFGWALRRLMSSPNVQVTSQEDFASELTKRSGYEVSQQLISDYMRMNEVKDPETGEIRYEPRVIPRLAFVWAVVSAFDLSWEETEDLVTAWFAVLPKERQEAGFLVGKVLKHRGVDFDGSLEDGLRSLAEHTPYEGFEDESDEDQYKD